MDGFPWDSLPTEIQRSILSLLPVSTLIVCTSVSTSLRSTIQSPSFTSTYKQKSAETVILFPDCPPTSNEAYSPSSGRCFSLPIPENVAAVEVSDGPSVKFSDGSSVLAQIRLHDQDNVRQALLVYNPFRPNLNPKPVPPPPKGYRPLGFFTLRDSPISHFMIVAVSFDDTSPTRSQIYDSAIDEWRFAGEIRHRIHHLSGSVFMEDDGLFYCVGRSHDCILCLDIVTYKWSILGLTLPSQLPCWYRLFGFSGRLFTAVTYMSADGAAIWELDRTAMKWNVACVMPDEKFTTFCPPGTDKAFVMIHCGGLVCYFNRNGSGETLGESMMVCDVLGKRWWRSRQCPFRRDVLDRWYSCHAVEPCIDLVRGGN